MTVQLWCTCMGVLHLCTSSINHDDFNRWHWQMLARHARAVPSPKSLDEPKQPPQHLDNSNPPSSTNPPPIWQPLPCRIHQVAKRTTQLPIWVQASRQASKLSCSKSTAFSNLSIPDMKRKSTDLLCHVTLHTTGVFTVQWPAKAAVQFTMPS